MSCSICGSINPCNCVEQAAIREQGPPGPGGVPGGTPVFTIGTVTSGAFPAVTVTQINPLLYQLNFVIPSVKITTDNFWTGIQSFDKQVIMTAGFAASGDSTAEQLTVSTSFTSLGTALFVGVSTFTAEAIFQGGIAVTGGATFDHVSITGDLAIPNIPALAPNVCYKGYVVADSCGRLRYVNAFSPNSASNSSAISQTVVFNQAETAIAMTLPFTVPSVPDCGSAMSVNATIFGRLVTAAGGALPADISTFVIRVRLDNAVTGTTLAGPSITNFESQGEWYVNAQLTPGAHTLFFTISGNGVGTSSIQLIFIECAINF